MAISVEVVLSPALLPLTDLKGKTVVVIDILRASSSICVAFQTGAKKILPVATPEEARLFRDFDFLTAAERNAVKLEGFDLGNSPFDFENPLIRDRNIAFTTTNGTKAIRLAKEKNAAQILIGSFLNLSALCNYLIAQKQPVVLFCAGWKDNFNMEDTLFAGAVIHQMQAELDEITCDSALAALTLYTSAQGNLLNLVNRSSHARRFKTLHAHTDDVAYCMQTDTLDIVPVLEGEYIVPISIASSSHL